MEENEKKMGKEEEKGKRKREKMRDLIQIFKIWGVPVIIIPGCTVAQYCILCEG